MKMGSPRATLVFILLFLIAKKSSSKPLSIEARLALQPSNTRQSDVDQHIIYHLQLAEDRNEVIVTQGGTSKRIALEEICPLDSDCERFLIAVKFFLLELGGSFAGLSWGAWSTLVFSINQINSDQ